MWLSLPLSIKLSVAESVAGADGSTPVSQYHHFISRGVFTGTEEVVVSVSDVVSAVQVVKGKGLVDE